MRLSPFGGRGENGNAKWNPNSGVGGKRNALRKHLQPITRLQYPIQRMLNKPRQYMIPRIRKSIRVERIVHHLFVGVDAVLGEDHFFFLRATEIIQHTIRMCFGMKLSAEPFIGETNGH